MVNEDLPILKKKDKFYDKCLFIFLQLFFSGWKYKRILGWGVDCICVSDEPFGVADTSKKVSDVKRPARPWGRASASADLGLAEPAWNQAGPGPGWGPAGRPGLGLFKKNRI